MSSLNMNNKPNYCKDNVFDSFDLREYFSQTINITPTNKNNFIYKNDLHKLNNNNHRDNTNIQPSLTEIYQLINQNHFGIKIETIEIEKPNEHPSLFIEHYTPLNLIGQGSFGLVISVISKATQQKMAVKIIKKDYNLFDSSSLEKEVSIFKALQNNKYTIKLYDVIETNEYLFLFMDLIEGGSLKDFILERYNNSIKDSHNIFCTDKEIRIIMTGILKAIQFLHKNNVMHRDLKPENILFRNKYDLTSIVIGDFGIADDSSKGISMNNKCGTLIYMAPEMLTDRPYDQLIDSWACGIIMYILESGGKHPIYTQGMNKNEYIKKLKEQKEWQFNIGFPNLARNFFLKLCKYESCSRYHTHKALKHPWIVGDDNVSCVIPLTFIEEYNRNDKVTKFKNMLSCFMYFNIFKTHNENLFTNRKNRTATYNFVFPFETPKLRKKSSSIHLKGTTTTTKRLFDYNNNAPSRKHNSIIGVSNYQISTSRKHQLNSNRNTSLDKSNHYHYHHQHNKDSKNNSQLKDKSFTIEYPSSLLKLKRNGSTGIICNLFSKDKCHINNNNIIKQQYQYHYQQIKNASALLQDKRKDNNSHINSFGHRCINKSIIKEEEKNEMRNVGDKEVNKSCKKGNVLYPEICKKNNGGVNVKKQNQMLKETSYMKGKKKKIKLLIGKSDVSSFRIGN